MDVNFVGRTDPIRRSPLGLGACTSAVLAGIAGQFQAITEAQGRPAGTATIDISHAALTISSMWLLSVDGGRALARFDASPPPGQGIFRTMDGRWIHLVSVFPQIVDATLNALGCDHESLEARIARDNASEIESVLAASNLPGVIIRDTETWCAEPQGRLLVDAPAVTIEKIADAPPIPLPKSRLAGLRLLDCTRVLAGPTIGSVLAALGAEVLQIGSPKLADLVSAQADTGAGKRRAFLDFGTAAGLGAMRSLVDGADIFSQSFRSESLSRYGLNPHGVSARRPGIIYVTTNAYGDFGPWREKRGFDDNVQAAVGIMDLHYGIDDPLDPDRVAMAMNDYNTGYWGAYGILEALRRRATEGGSWHVRVSLAQTAHWIMRSGKSLRPQDGMSNESLRSLFDSYSETANSGYGVLNRLRFPIRFDAEDIRWGDTVPPGTHRPTWDN